MPMYKFRDCLASEVDSQDLIPGSFLVCRDTGDIIYDSLEGNRVPLSKSAHKVDGLVETELFPQDGHLYYSTADKLVCMYHNGSFQPVNVTVFSHTFTDVEIDSNGSTQLTLSAVNEIGEYIASAVVNNTIDMAIYDLSSNFSVIGTTEINGGGISVTMMNPSSAYNWIGSVTIMVMATTKYYVSKG